MEVLGWLIILAVAVPVLNAMLPALVEVIEEGKERRERAAFKREIARLPPGERIMRYFDSGPVGRKPAFTPQTIKKGGGMGKLIIVALCIGYILFPIDLIPDFIPVLGWGDDLVAAIIGLRALIK